MNYLNITKSILLISIVVGFAACDKIPESDRIIEHESVACDTPSFPVLDLSNVIQKYLLEDFTGHTCNNCPKAHVIANNLKTKMGDTLVVIAIHAGDNARPTNGINCPFDADYRTDAGNQYAEEFKISAYPAGMINRMIFNSNQIVYHPNWVNTINGIPRKSATMGIQIMTKDGNDGTCLFVKTSLLSDVSEKLRLCVFIMEDRIVSAQKDGTREECEYVHNHVLRASIAPIWGDDLDISTNGESIIKGYTVRLQDAWKKEHCHIMAFVYNVDTKEILQVEEIKLF